MESKSASGSIAGFMAGAALLAMACGVGRDAAATDMTLEEFGKQTHFHGLSVDSGDSSRLYLATHHGLFVLDARRTVRRISAKTDDFMGFTVHPTDPTILYASGHPVAGGNLGFIRSEDGGRSWSKLSEGVGGPVDFHQLDVSKADPKVIYGVHGTLQRSNDGGQTWKSVGAAPEGVISIAASSKNVDTIYAGTRSGLVRSQDAGRTWSFAHPLQRTVSVVHVAPSGIIYAFFVGSGLWKASEASLEWQPMGSGFGQKVPLHLATDPADDRRMFAIALDSVNQSPSILASSDGGGTWQPYGNAE